MFSLVLDDIGVKHVVKKHRRHLITCSFSSLYQGVILWSQFGMGISISTCHLVYPRMCGEFNTWIPTKNDHMPPECTTKLEQPEYGDKTRWAPNQSKKPMLLPEEGNIYIEKLVGNFLLCKNSGTHHASSTNSNTKEQRTSQ